MKLKMMRILERIRFGKSHIRVDSVITAEGITAHDAIVTMRILLRELEEIEKKDPNRKICITRYGIGYEE